MESIPELPDRSSESPAEANLQLKALLAVPRPERDEAWRQSFYGIIPDALLRLADPPLITGPDGFPYRALQVPESGYRKEGIRIREFITGHWQETGAGIVLNPVAAGADWVFSYGDLLNWLLRNEFYTKPDVVISSGSVTLSPHEQLLITQPSPEYLPYPARKVIRKYLQQAGIAQPRCFLLTQRDGASMIQRLVFNIETEVAAQLPLKLQHLSWFLPRHYIIAALPEQDDLARHFSDL